MSRLRAKQRTVAVATTKKLHTDEVSTDEIVELLLAFFFQHNIPDISGKKIAKVWPSFLSNIHKHGIEIPHVQAQGILFLENGMRSMMRDGHLLSYSDGDDRRFRIELTDRKIKQIRDSMNEKLVSAISHCAVRALRTYKSLPNL